MAGTVAFLDGASGTGTPLWVSALNPLPVTAVAASAGAPIPNSAPTTGAITSNQSVTFQPTNAGYASYGFAISGTWTGLIIIEATVDGTNWYPTTAVPFNSSAVGAFTANNAGQGSFSGAAAIRFRGNTVGSGTANVTIVGNATTSTVMQDNLHWSTNLDQINGTTVDTNIGVPTAGTIRTIEASNSFTNINTATTTVVKSGAGKFHSITINTVGAGSTATIYDNTAGSGTKIATVNTASSQTTIVFDCAFATGLTVVTTATAPDITIMYR